MFLTLIEAATKMNRLSLWYLVICFSSFAVHLFPAFSIVLLSPGHELLWWLSMYQLSLGSSSLIPRAKTGSCQEHEQLLLPVMSVRHLKCHSCLLLRHRGLTAHILNVLTHSMSEVLFRRNFMALCKANAIIDSAREQNLCHLPNVVMYFHQYSESNLSLQWVAQMRHLQIYPFLENQLLYHPTKQSRRKAIVITYQSIDCISTRSIFFSPAKC